MAIPDIPQTGEKVEILSDMKQGLAAIRANKPLMAVLIPMLLVNVIFMPLGSLFPLLVRIHFLGEAWHNSIVEFVFAGGLCLGWHEESLFHRHAHWSFGGRSSQ